MIRHIKGSDGTFRLNDKLRRPRNRRIVIPREATGILSRRRSREARAQVNQDRLIQVYLTTIVAESGGVHCLFRLMLLSFVS